MKPSRNNVLSLPPSNHLRNILKGVLSSPVQIFWAAFLHSGTYFFFLLPVLSPPGIWLSHLSVFAGSMFTALGIICSRYTVLQENRKKKMFDRTISWKCFEHSWHWIEFKRIRGRLTFLINMCLCSQLKEESRRC